MMTATSHADRGRTKGGKVDADSGVDVETRHTGDGAASAEELFRHSIRLSTLPLLGFIDCNVEVR